MDKMLFKIMNDFAGRYSTLDKVMIIASNRIRYIFMVVLFFLNKKIIIRSVLSVVINMYINRFVNRKIYKPRPFFVSDVNLLIPSKHDSSYLSKHTLLTFAVSTMVFHYKRMLGRLLFSLSVLTGISRVWTGAHYPSDVIRSAFVGSLVSTFIKRLTK